jgi:hypothetical protein
MQYNLTAPERGQPKELTMTKLYEVYLDDKLISGMLLTKESALKLADEYRGKGLTKIISVKTV